MLWGMRYTLLCLLAVSCASPEPRPKTEACVALTPNSVEIRFRERDGRSSSKLVAPGTVTRAENVVMTKPGTYQRRTGSDAVESVSGAKELTTYSGALVTMSDTQLKQRIAGAFTTPASSALRWSAVTSSRSLETGDDQIAHSHVRAADGRDWHVWENYNGAARAIKYSVVDPTTGAHIVHDATVATGTRPAILAVGTRILIFYVAGASVNNAGANTSLLVATINQSAPGTIVGSSNVDTADFISPASDTFFASMPYDVVTKDSSTAVVATRILDAGVAKTRIRTWDAASATSTGVVTETTGQASVGHDVIGFLNHDFADSNYYVGTGFVASATGFRTLLLQVIPTSLASVTNHTLKTEAGNIGTNIGWKNVCGFVDSSLTAHVLADVVNHAGDSDASAAMKWHYYATRTSGGSIAAATRPGLGLASKPWQVINGDRYILLSHTSYVQPTYFVSDPTTGTIHGRFFAGSAGLVDNENSPFVTSPVGGTYPERRSKLPTPQMVGDTATIAVAKLQFAPLHVISAANSAGVSRGAWIVSLTSWTAGGEYQPALSSDVLLLAGGAPREFDGGSIVESGFHLFPEVVPAASVGSLPSLGSGNVSDARGFDAVNGNVADGTYFLKLVFEWTDSRGRVHQSAPSLPFSVTLSGGLPNGESFRVLNPLTSKTGVKIVVYRTTVNAAESATYYRTSEWSTGSTLGSLSTGSNLYTSVYISEGDSTVVNNEQLYTTGGVLDNAPAFAMRQAKPWKDRVMFLLEENRRAFGWSKLVKPDLGLEWSDSFFFEVNDEFGDFTALAPLGSNFLFFKRNAVYWISDAGPDDTGTGQFAEPRRLDGFLGTELPRSVITTEQGVFYQAPDQVIWLITPSLERVPIGEPCADINLTVVGAVEVPDKRQVRFHTGSTTLVYDSLHKVWTTFTGQGALAATMFGATAHYLSSSGGTVRKDSTAFDEAGTSYQAVLEFAWFSLNQLAGYQRVWSGDIVGETLGAYTLSAVLTSDFGTTTTTKSLASSSFTAQHGHLARFHVPLSLQQKTALRLKLQDNSPSTAGGLWEGVNLQCGFAPGRRPPLPSAHRMS